MLISQLWLHLMEPQTTITKRPKCDSKECLVKNLWSVIIHVAVLLLLIIRLTTTMMLGLGPEFLLNTRSSTKENVERPLPGIIGLKEAPKPASTHSIWKWWETSALVERDPNVPTTTLNQVAKDLLGSTAEIMAENMAENMEEIASNVTVNVHAIESAEIAVEALKGATD